MQTERLLLRVPTQQDGPSIVRVNGQLDVARGTSSFPHPYTEQHALEWIELCGREHDAGTSVQWVITLAPSAELIGSIGLRLTPEHGRGMLGYVLDVHHWGLGYATEAVRAVINHGFDMLGLERIEATHWGWNAASGRVLQKVGFRHEGVMRRRFKRLGEWQDEVCYGMLRSDRASPPGAT
ncbi:MAG: GNAT family protein [Planctomycetota bacterium]